MKDTLRPDLNKRDIQLFLARGRALQNTRFTQRPAYHSELGSYVSKTSFPLNWTRRKGLISLDVASEYHYAQFCEGKGREQGWNLLNMN